MIGFGAGGCFGPKSTLGFAGLFFGGSWSTSRKTRALPTACSITKIFKRSLLFGRTSEGLARGAFVGVRSQEIVPELLGRVSAEGLFGIIGRQCGPI